MSESEVPRDAQPLQPRDSRLETFLRKAAPILAMERGVTKAARIKLRALADELRLPESVLEQAITDLGRDWARRQFSRSERQFLHFLRKELQGLPRQILTERLEQRAAKIGEDKFQLTAERARDLVRTEAAALGFNRVSRSEAENYIRQLSLGMLAGLEAEDVKRQRLLDAAKAWGLSESDVDEIVRGAHGELRRQRQVRASSPTRIALAVTLVLTALVGGIGWWIVQQNRPPVPDNAASRAAAQAAPALPQPTWWDGPLYQLASRSAGTSAAVRNFLLAAASEDPGTRKRAYGSVTAGTPLDPKSGLTNELILRVLLSEPDLPLLTQTLTGLLESLDEPAELPTVGQYQVARNNLELWKLAGQQQATGQLERDSKSGKLVASLVENVAGLTPTILSERYLATVAGLAGRHPRNAASFLVQAPFPSEVGRSVAFSEATFAVLEADIETWRTLRPVLVRLIATGETTSLIPWLDWIDAGRDPEFAGFLAEQLADRLGIRLAARDVAGWRAELQRVLVPPSPLEQNLEARRIKLISRIQELRRRPHSLEPQAQSIANEAYLATLAWCWWCCQQTGQLEFGPFDTLLEQNVRELGRTTSPDRSTGTMLRQANRLATAVDRDAYLGALARLGDSAAGDAPKLQALQQLAAVADRFPDIDSEDAERIVRFVLAAREQDLSEVEGALWTMRHWPTLILALFDAFEAAPADAPRAALVLRTVVPSAFPETGKTPPKSQVAQAVLQFLLRGLGESLQVSSGVQARPWGRLELYFLELIQTRAAMTELAFGRSVAGNPEFELNRLQREVIEGLLASAAAEPERLESVRRRLELAWREAASLARAALLERVLLESIAVARKMRPDPIGELQGKLDATSRVPDLLLEVETKLVDLLVGDDASAR